VAVAIQHINGGAAMPSTFNPNIPGGMEQIIMKAMAHDPADRYASATAMLYDMDEFRKSPGILFNYSVTSEEAVTRPQTEQTATPVRTTADRVASSAAMSKHRQTARPAAVPGKGLQKTPAPRKPEPAKRRRDTYEEEESRSKIATIAVIVCSVVAVIAIVVFLIALLGSGDSGKSNLVSVPTLVGKNYDMLQISDDFVLKSPNYEHNDQYEKGQIIRQLPEQGTQVEKGTEIHIWISLGPEPKVKVMENLVGQERTTAENYLSGQKILFLCYDEYSETVKAGHVIRTDPEAGVELEDGQTVLLYISIGPETEKKNMPNVVGQNLETAKTILNNQKLNLTIKELEENSNTVEEKHIIRTEPAVGEEVKTGDTVTLYVSKGPVKAKMPKVAGEDITTALKMLNAAGLVNITYDAYVESEEPKDTVVEQSVAAGEEVPVTTTIVLKLSEGPKPKETKKMVKFGLMEDALEPYPVKIVRKDTGEVVFEATMAPSKTVIELELSGIGKITYVVTLGGGNAYELEVDFETA